MTHSLFFGGSDYVITEDLQISIGVGKTGVATRGVWNWYDSNGNGKMDDEEWWYTDYFIPAIEIIAPENGGGNPSSTTEFPSLPPWIPTSPTGGGSGGNNGSSNTGGDNDELGETEQSYDLVKWMFDWDTPIRNDFAGLIEELLKEMLKDCMGSVLFNNLALNGPFNLEVVSVLRPGVNGYFTTNGTFTFPAGGISAGTLSHEMVHAVQFYGNNESVTSFENKKANLELEARIAEYRVTGELPNTNYSDLIRYVSREYISQNGTQLNPNSYYSFNSIYSDTIELIQAHYATNGVSLSFAPGQSFSTNFQTLRFLSANC
jgi:hypothetical protein